MQEGIARRIISKPSDTSLTTAYTQSIEGVAFIHSINIAAVSGADATVILNDGSTDYEILSAKTMNADDREFLEWRKGLLMRQNDVLKVQSSSGNALVFTAEIEEVMRGPA